MRKSIRILLARQKQALKASPPKSRDRLRHRLHVLMKVAQLRKEDKAAA